MTTPKHDPVPMSIDPTYHEVRPGDDAKLPYEEHYGPEYWEYRRKWNEYPKQHIVADFPIHLDLEVTNHCNLKCPHCYRTLAIKNKTFGPQGLMSWELFTKCIDEGAQHGLCSVKFNYQGEPLMHPRLCDMIKYCKDKGIVEVMFNTNGVLLTDELSRGIIEAGLDKIIFSFDAADPELYHQLRYPATLEETQQKILRFLEIKKEMKSIFPVTRISMVKMKDNEEDVENLIAYWKPRLDLVTFVDYHNQAGYDTVEGRKLTGNRKTRFACAQLWQRMFVWWNGKLTLCCGDYEGTHAMGNANQSSLKEIWQGEQYNKLRQWHIEGQYHKIEICKNCDLNVI
jgi:pyruvate-formate lyase-activating enzyme